MSKNEWFNKGMHRKKQIYNWFNDVTRANGLSFYLTETRQLIARGKTSEAINKFSNLVSYIKNTRPMLESGDTLGYLLDKAINRHGKNAVVNDLFRGVLGSSVARIPKVLLRTKRVTKRSIEEVEQQVRQKGLIFKARNSKNQIADATIVKLSPTDTRFRDVTTGRFVKPTIDTLKRVKERTKKNE